MNNEEDRRGFPSSMMSGSKKRPRTHPMRPPGSAFAHAGSSRALLDTDENDNDNHRRFSTGGIITLDANMNKISPNTNTSTRRRCTGSPGRIVARPRGAASFTCSSITSKFQGQRDQRRSSDNMLTGITYTYHLPLADMPDDRTVKSAPSTRHTKRSSSSLRRVALTKNNNEEQDQAQTKLGVSYASDKMSPRSNDASSNETNTFRRISMTRMDSSHSLPEFAEDLYFESSQSRCWSGDRDNTPSPEQFEHHTVLGASKVPPPTDGTTEQDCRRGVLRCVLIASVALVAILGLGVGLGFSLSNKKPLRQQQPPQQKPQQRYYVQAGPHIDGPARSYTPTQGGVWGNFGATVSINGPGTRVAVGAPDYSSNGERSRGLVQVFEERGGQWILLTPTVLGERPGDRTGTAVALSLDGETLAAGSPDHFEPSLLGRAGKVKVYQRTHDGSWAQLGPTIVGKSSWERLGSSVSLSQDGKRIAVSAPGRSHSSGHDNDLDIEKARVYEISSDGKEWTQLGDDLLGVNGGSPVSMSADGTAVSLGSFYRSDRGSGAAAIRVYEYDVFMKNWRPRGNDIAYDMNGDFNVALKPELSADGKTVAIGTELLEGTTSGDSILCAKTYQYDDDLADWIQLGETFSADVESESYLKSYTVSLSSNGNVLTVVAVNGAGDVGSFMPGVRKQSRTQVFRLEQDEWRRIDTGLKGSDANDVDHLGEAVSLSADGRRLVIGSPRSQALNGEEVGRVTVFQLD